MPFNKSYFDSGEHFQGKNILYRVRKSLFSDRNSRKHYASILLNRWENLKKCPTILDVGCGKGEFLKVNPYKKEVFGTDVIPETLKILEEEGFKTKLGDITKKLPYLDNSFDGLNLSHVLEHLNEPTTAILEIKRVLKNKGKLMIIVPNFTFKEFHNDYTHKKPYTQMSLFRLLIDNNFSKVQVKKGPCLNKFLSMIFFLTPKLRFRVEMFVGKLFPSEFIAIAQNEK